MLRSRGWLTTEAAALGRAAEALGHVALLGRVARVAVHVVEAVDVVERELVALGDVLDGEQRQVVDVLVGVVADAREDAQVGLARVVDEARRGPR